MPEAWTVPQAVRSALGRLGIDRLVLSVHQASFPPSSDDIGYGTPYSERSRQWIQWLAQLGFTGIALGPPGTTSRTNPSPYDATALSRNPLHIAWGPLAAEGWLDERRLQSAVAERSADADRVAYADAWNTQHRLLAAVADRAGGDPAVVARVQRLRQREPWLQDEARFEAVAAALGNDNWQRWPENPPEDSQAAGTFMLAQLIVREQHAAFRSRCRRLGLRVWGDLPIGTSHRDRFLFQRLFLPGYAMGAPPSRTNPEGQPWGYPVLAPDQLAAGGEAWRYAAIRMDALLQDHDSLRIDHPHGWICPWVYRIDDPDPIHAVQHGARLFESPDLPDHPALAAYARVRPDQIDPAQPRHADEWVRTLEPAQVDQYARPFDLIVQRIRAFGGDPADVMVEVLSTCPRPLAEVLARHRLGRYRVTQKARLHDPHDVYRSDQARPQDWIMVGNHDTPPLRSVIDGWRNSENLPQRVRYLADRLEADSEQRTALAERLARDPDALATAMFADLFCGPARNVLIFWADLFGLREAYNRPGVIDADNWSLRVPADFEQAYRDARDRGQAPDLAQALRWALHARGLDRDAEGRALAAALQPPGSPRGFQPNP